jgi:protocatechuate 3,4-dioxygenase beta subunit
MTPHRRRLIGGLAAALALPSLAAARRAARQMTDGPFYPPRTWRALWSDWDADLTRVSERGRTLHAGGEHLGLELRVIDTAGRVVDDAEVEIWQCDRLRHYRHPDVARDEAAAGQHWDPGFQGFGAARSSREGTASFRTIRPVPYPGRTPHIHLKLRHPSFGEWTSQLFVAGDEGNARDFLWRRLGAEDRAALEMALQRVAAGPAAGDAPALAWLARHELVLPA